MTHRRHFLTYDKEHISTKSRQLVSRKIRMLIDVFSHIGVGMIIEATCDE